MDAYNVVRFKVKPGKEQAFLDAHKDAPDLEGLEKAVIVKTGDRTYCFVGEWESLDKLAAARPKMVGMLDKVRGMLEDLGGGLGVTDPVSGEVVMKL